MDNRKIYDNAFITAFDIDGVMCDINPSFCSTWDNLDNLEMIQTWIWEGCPE